MKKSYIFISLVLSAMIGLPQAVRAAEVTGSISGTSVTWAYNDATKTLSFRGTGSMGDEGLIAADYHTEYWDKAEKVVCANGVTHLGQYALYAFTKTETLSILYLTSVGRLACWRMDALKTVQFGKNLQYVDPEAFAYCQSIEQFNLQSPTGSDRFTTTDGCLYSADMETLYFYPAGKEQTSYTVPEGVKYLSECAFTQCTHLKTLVLPSTLRSIGCRNLHMDSSDKQTSITDVYLTGDALPDGYFVDSTEMNFNVFPNAKQITIHVQTKELGEEMLANPYWNIFTIDYPKTAEEKPLTSLFTVNEDGDQVVFSQGNLQYQASTDTWRFAENQWDIVGIGYGQIDTTTYNYLGGSVANSDNREISDTYSGWIDLFGFGTSGWYSSAGCYRPYDASTISLYYCPNRGDDNDLTGNYANADWGVYNAISNGGDQAGLWRTLTADEWDYIWRQRPNAQSLFALAAIDTVVGFVFLPDDWTTPEGLSFVGNGRYIFDENIYTYEQWQQMEAAGAVFFPGAGYREGKTVYGTGVGVYWTTTKGEVDYSAQCFFAGNGYDNGLTETERHFGLSVRLVQDAPADTGIEEIAAQAARQQGVHKVLSHDGQVYILREGKAYNLMGVEVK